MTALVDKGGSTNYSGDFDDNGNVGRAAKPRYASGKLPISTIPSATAVASKVVETADIDQVVIKKKFKAKLQFTDVPWQQEQEMSYKTPQYISGKSPVSAKPSPAASLSKMANTVNVDKAMTEEEKLKAMQQLTEAQWQQAQEEMSNETQVPMQGRLFNEVANVPEGEPPPGYICYSCGEKGNQSLLVPLL